MLLVEQVIARSRVLRAHAVMLCADARATRQRVVRGVRARRRRFLLGRGANYDAIETGALRCPHCQGARITATVHVVAAKGMLKISYRCEGCEKPFVYVRATRDVFDRSADLHR